MNDKIIFSKHRKRSDKLPKGIIEYEKKDLFNLDDLISFSFESVVPLLREEAEFSDANIVECFKTEDVDYYINTSAKTIGVQVILKLMPDEMLLSRMGKTDFSGEFDNGIVCNKMEKKGYEFAKVLIEVESTDKVRSARKLFVKNDEFKFVYKGLKKFKYNNFSKINVCLAIPGDEWKYILGWPTEDKSISDPWNDPLFASDRENVETRNKIINQTAEVWSNTEFLEDVYYKLSNEYTLKSNNIDEDFFLNLFKLLGFLLEGIITPKDLIVNIYNYMEYLKGNLLCDSESTVDNEKITKMMSLTNNNPTLYFDLKERAYFSYAIYLALVDFEFLNSILKKEESIDEKALIFKERLKEDFIRNPQLFGYEFAKEEVDRIVNINSDENISKMNKYVDKYSEYAAKEYKFLTKKILNKDLVTTTELEEVLNKLEKVKEECRKVKWFLSENFDCNLDKKNNKFKKKSYHFFTVFEDSVLQNLLICQNIKKYRINKNRILFLKHLLLSSKSWFIYKKLNIVLLKEIK